MNGSSDVRVDVLTDEAPEELWGRVAGLYIGAFSAPPYEEDPASSRRSAHGVPISSGARRRGVGTACLQALEHAAGRAGTVLAVYEHAEDAKRFYARQGFRSLGAATLRNGTTLRILARGSS